VKTVRARVAGNDAFNDNAVAGGGDAWNVTAKHTDPFVAENQGITNIQRIDITVDEFNISPAHSRDDRRHHNFVICRLWILEYF
jgi:hypothetical protein